MREENPQPAFAPALALLLIVIAWLPGCSSAEVALVNEAAMAHRTSPSDDDSRQLALSTQPLLEEQALDYRVGPDDILSVSIFEWMVREEMKTVDVRVTETGTITLPLLGTVKAEGRTVAEIEQALCDLLVTKGFIKIPRVSVLVKEFRSKAIAVVGAVKTPGRFSLRQNVITLLDALALAGGTDERAGYVLFVVRPRTPGEPGESQAQKKRKGSGEVDPSSREAAAGAIAGQSTKKEVIAVDLYELYELGDLSLNVVLRHRDVVYVPEAPQFYVLGFVRQPGGFPLKRPTTVLDGIALAQGLMENEASPRSCLLKRKQADGEVVIPLDLVAISTGKDPNLYLEANDIIDVRQTGWKKFGVEALDFIKRVFHVGYNLEFDRNND